MAKPSKKKTKTVSKKRKNPFLAKIKAAGLETFGEFIQSRSKSSLVANS